MHGIQSGSRIAAARLLQSALIVSGCLSLTACLGKDKPAPAGDSQVAADVNDSEISIHQVQSILQRQPQLSAQLGEAASGRVLDSLIEQELAAQGARAVGLDGSPKVLQAMELAKREVLARAYQDMLADKAAISDTKSIDAYYEAHPELFANRRQYTLQEMQVQAKPEQAKALAAKLSGLTGTQAVNAAVVDSGLPHSGRVTVQWAEGLPMDLLPKLASLGNGQSIGVAAPGGLLIMTVLQSQEVPITRSAADKSIQAALMAARREELVKQGMAELRQKAKIVRKGAFAAPAAPSGASPASGS
jgi:EpsD family peptidyl-prolyl cis-trans isomerase